jgi:preprotein translocase subunit YajC
MNILTFFLLQADAAAPKAGGGYSMLIVLALIFVVMWLFMIRPQKKKQKELDEFRNNLKKGDKVITIGGIYGTVDEVKENKILIEIDKDVKTEGLYMTNTRFSYTRKTSINSPKVCRKLLSLSKRSALLLKHSALNAAKSPIKKNLPLLLLLLM